MTKDVVLIIVDSLYFFCHSRVSLSGIYKIIYYSSVIPAKQLSGNLSNNKHPFFCRCRHCERKRSNPLSKITIDCHEKIKIFSRNDKKCRHYEQSEVIHCCRHCERKWSNPVVAFFLLTKVFVLCHWRMFLPRIYKKVFILCRSQR